MSKTEELSKRARILQLIVDSQVDHHRPASREWLRQQTGYNFGTIDEQIKVLRSDGDIYSETPGYYFATPALPPDQPITVTVLNNGMRKLERGDDLWNIAPHEWAVLGDLTAGAAQRARQRENDRELIAQISTLAAMTKNLRKQLDEASKKIAAMERKAQQDLFAAPWRTPATETQG